MLLLCEFPQRLNFSQGPADLLYAIWGLVCQVCGFSSITRRTHRIRFSEFGHRWGLKGRFALPGSSITTVDWSRGIGYKAVQPVNVLVDDCSWALWKHLHAIYVLIASGITWCAAGPRYFVRAANMRLASCFSFQCLLHIIFKGSCGV